MDSLPQGTTEWRGSNNWMSDFNEYIHPLDMSRDEEFNVAEGS